MTYEVNPSGFRSTTQAEAIANILDHMSRSDAYDEKAAAISKKILS